MKNNQQIPSTRSPYLVIVFLLLATAVGLTGYHYYDYQKIQLQKEIQNQLLVVAELKVEQVVNWREERLADAAVFLSSPALLSDIRHILINAGTAEMKGELLARFAALKKHNGYTSVHLVDAQGSVRVATDRKDVPDDLEKKQLAETLLHAKTTFSDFHRSKQGIINLDLIAPIMAHAGKERSPAGALVLRIDPSLFLYPLIESWPTKSRTAETLLVKRKGDDILYLNELRFKKNTALTFRSSLTTVALPAAMSAQGNRGIVESLDYRGVPVLAALSAVPDTPWLMVAKVDQEEIYAPIRQRAGLIAAFIVSFIVAAGLGVGYWDRKQNVVFYRRQLEAEVEFSAERKKMEGELHEQLNFLHVLIESIPLPVFYKNVQGLYLGCNSAYERFLGIGKGALVGKAVYDMAPKDLADIYRAMDSDLFDHAGIQSYESTMAHADGSRHEVIITKGTFAKEDGAIAGLVGAVTDITERKRAEDAVRQSEEKIKLLLDSTGEAIYGIDMDGNCTFCNAACVRVLGYERPDELLGRNMHFLIHHTHKDGTPNPVETCEIFRAFRQGEGVHIAEDVFWRADGTDFPVECWSFPQKRDNVMIGAVVTFVDITERKKNSDELKHRQLLLEELNETLEARVRAEVEKNREMDRLMMTQGRHAAMGEMIGNIAHQWRQPINVIGLIMQDLHDAFRHGSLTEEYLAKNVGQGMAVIQHMSQTIDDFRNFFSQDKERQEFSANDVIDRTLSFVEAGFKNSNIELSLETEEEILINGFPNEYSQAVLNILNNAKDALVEGKVRDPRVRIRLFREGNRSVMAIADNAGGIRPEVLEKIFDPYFTTKQEGKGTGIGLYISKNIIEEHMAGSLTVKNIPGGAEFSITV